MANDFIREDELPSNWVEAPARVIVPGQQVAAPAVGDITPTGSRYSSGTLPPQIQHDTHFVDAGAPSPRLPSHDLMPLAALAAINSAQTQAVIKIIQQSTPAPAPVVSGGGTIDGTVSNPHVPYASAPDTLSDSTWEFNSTGNVLSNPSTSSEIDMVGAGGNEVSIGMNSSGSFPTFLSLDDSDGGSFFFGLKPASHEALFSFQDSDGDGMTLYAQNGFGVNTQWVASTLVDNAILDVGVNNSLLQFESGLGGLLIWSLDTDGSSDFEMVDSANSLTEIFLDGLGASYLSIADASVSNEFRVDVNKGDVAGTVALTLRSPAPSIDLGGGGPTITAGSGAPSGTPVNGSLYMRSGGTHAALTLLYVYDAATTSWIGIG